MVQTISNDQGLNMTNNKITLIGDMHGDMAVLQMIQNSIPKNERSIQLGDMGFGWERIPEFAERHTFIRGNHDDPAEARAHKNYLGDFGYLPEDNLFFISGAASIDRKYRTEGKSWWRDEQLSFSKLNAAYDLYVAAKPEIVVSHECPVSANKALLDGLIKGPDGGYYAAKATLKETRTCQAMEAMFKAHQPRLWVFGHYHIDKTVTIRNTAFQCVGINHTMVIATPLKRRAA
jgi:hypothetical protein